MITKEQAETLVDQLCNLAMAKGVYAAGGLVANIPLGTLEDRIKEAESAILAAIRSPVEVATLRDQMAMAAMPGILANGGGFSNIDSRSKVEDFTALAYAYADAMLSARGEVTP